MIDDTKQRAEQQASAKRPRQLLTERITSLDGYRTLDELAWFRNESYFQTRRWLIAHQVRCYKIGSTILVPPVAVDLNTMENLLPAPVNSRPDRFSEYVSACRNELESLLAKVTASSEGASAEAREGQAANE